MNLFLPESAKRQAVFIVIINNHMLVVCIM